eukprot:m.7224 g.7224  ORF g.7224 m.7224 type:complete len:424 (+) comp3670_c1_seq2:355-1626(+)
MRQLAQLPCRLFGSCFRKHWRHAPVTYWPRYHRNLVRSGLIFDNQTSGHLVRGQNSFQRHWRIPALTYSKNYGPSNNINESEGTQNTETKPTSEASTQSAKDVIANTTTDVPSYEYTLERLSALSKHVESLSHRLADEGVKSKQAADAAAQEAELMAMQVSALNEAVEKLATLLEASQLGPKGHPDKGSLVLPFTKEQDLKYKEVENSTKQMQSRVAELEGVIVSTATAVNEWTRLRTGVSVINTYTITLFAVSLILFLLFREEIYKMLGQEAATVAAITMDNENLIRSVRETVVAIGNSPEAVESVTQLVEQVLQQPQTQQAVTDLLEKLIKDPYITKTTAEDLVVPVLNWPSVREHMTEQATKVAEDTLANPSVHRIAGNGLWEAFIYGFIPRWRRSEVIDTALAQQEMDQTSQRDAEPVA